jgi:acetylornithine deacetylase/succinyl-diaminopimelate desuccinylase-like protein
MVALAEDAAERQPPCDQYQLYTSDEEGSQRGAATLTDWLAEEVQDRYTTLGGIILEPTGASYIGSGIRGDTNWNIDSRGPGGHGSQEFDRPAIERIATFIAGLTDLRKVWAEKYSDPFFGRPTINVPIFHGGEVANVVPTEAISTCNLRVTPQLLVDLEEIRQELETIYDITIQQPHQPCPTVCAPTEHIYTTVKQALPEMPFRVFPGSTEQPFFHALGIPMLTLGPGDDATMHTPNESVRISSIALCEWMLTRIIKHF